MMEEVKPKIGERMREHLRSDFPKEAYASHPTKSFLTVLKAMYVTERLNDVFGLGRWYVNTEVVERTNDYVLVKGTFVSLDYEVKIPDQYGGHKTTGTNTEIADGYKSAVTDCISKLASYLEIGIDMFKGKIKVEAMKSVENQEDLNKKWLNKFMPDKKTLTKEWNNVIVAVEQGKITEISEIRKHYKVSKETALDLETLLK